MVSNRQFIFEDRSFNFIFQYFVAKSREGWLEMGWVSMFHIKSWNSVKNKNLFYVGIKFNNILSSRYHVLGCNCDLLFQIFKVMTGGCVKICNVGGGALEDGKAVVSFGRRVSGNIVEVFMRFVCISFVSSSKGFFCVNKGVSGLFKMSDIRVGTNRVCNKEHFWPF